MRQEDASEVNLERRSTAVTSILAGVLLVLIIQLWLVHIALEAHLAANPTVAIPTFIASLVCFGINLGMLKFLYAVDSTKE